VVDVVGVRGILVSGRLLYWENSLLSSKLGVIALLPYVDQSNGDLEIAFHSTSLATSSHHEPAPENISPLPATSTMHKGK
jgi:hypothetical protein